MVTSTAYKLRTITNHIAHMITKGRAYQWIDEKLGRDDHYHLFKVQGMRSFVVLFYENTSLGYAGIYVLSAEQEWFNMFWQNSQDFPKNWEKWTDLTKAKYMLEWWQ